MTGNPSAEASWLYLDLARATQQIGDPQMVRTMLPMLQELLDRDLPQIAQFLEQGDVRGANPLLHSMKGCMPIFCTPALCDHLVKVELLSKDGAAVDVAVAYAELGPKLVVLQSEVARYLAQNA